MSLLGASPLPSSCQQKRPCSAAENLGGSDLFCLLFSTCPCSGLLLPLCLDLHHLCSVFWYHLSVHQAHSSVFGFLSSSSVPLTSAKHQRDCSRECGSVAMQPILCLLCWSAVACLSLSGHRFCLSQEPCAAHQAACCLGHPLGAESYSWAVGFCGVSLPLMF